jgi:hypothetical protein
MSLIHLRSGNDILSETNFKTAGMGGKLGGSE